MLCKGGLGVLAALTLLGAPLVAAADPAGEETARIEFFEKKIRPILANNCFNCHSADTNSKGGLRVDDRNGLIAGGGRGSAVVPGEPDKSLLLRAVSYANKDLKMPPDKQLSEDQVADLRKWIQEGAAWPKVEIPADLGKPAVDYEKLRQEHWAWQPLRQVTAPDVKDRS